MERNHPPSGSSTDTVSIGRRRLLAAGAGTAVAGFAGCTSALDFLGGLVLGDVNVINDTDQPRAGSILVTDADGETVLEESFDLEPSSSNDDGDQSETNEPDSSGGMYDDVLTGSGEYTVSVEMESGDEIGGKASAEGTVEVTDPENEHVVVGLGVGDSGERIEFVVIEELSDLETVGNTTNGS